jgi:CDP-glucose 4,6-dehydratase
MRPTVSDCRFWQGKRVLLTGHTGFKGGWAALWLHRLGARVTGLGLPMPAPSLSAILGIERFVPTYHVDLRDATEVADVVAACLPQLVLHMAAQPLVSQSLDSPVDTFATNLLGTVHLLQALRGVTDLEAVLVVTADTVYGPDPAGHRHHEADRLGGRDPFSASKAACELAVRAMADSFLAKAGVAVATARCGDVIGGGDFAHDRLVPDVVRAARARTPVRLRHPDTARPWLHVLDCVSGYLTYLAALGQGCTVPQALNFGPGPRSPRITAGSLAVTMLDALGAPTEYDLDTSIQPPCSTALALDTHLARESLGWRDRLNGTPMIEATAAWYRAWATGEEDMLAVTLRQIAAYEAMP